MSPSTDNEKPPSPPAEEPAALAEDGPSDFKRGFRFWAVILGLGVTAVLAALEHTVVTTSAPAILSELDLQQNYVWIASSFFICSAAFQPFIGQLCDVFGRRPNYLAIVALFTLGSGICGGATNGAMLIAGRSVQGIGSGGIIMMNNMIISDLVPLRFRGQYISVLLAFFGIGMALGPFIGGAIVDHTTWRWVFYLNLPIGGISLVITWLFLHLNHDRETTVSQKLKRIDYVGNAILVAATVAVLYSLTNAGTLHSWGSWQTLVPLLLGLLGLLLFAFYEVSGLPREPVTPKRLFVHRTSIIVSINTFLNSVVYFWILYFLPVYYQAVLLYSPSRTGYSLLPQALGGIPAAIVAALALSKWGKFKPIHFSGFALTTLCLGLLSLLDEDTSIAEWAVFQIIGALGIGTVIDTLLPAFQAPVSEKDQGAATAVNSFIRAFAGIWGVAIPSAIFNNRVDQLLETVSDVRARGMLANGGAFQRASATFVQQWSPTVQTEIRALYREALKRCWLLGIAFAGLATLLVLVEKEVPLRMDLETEYSLQDGKQAQTKRAEEGAASEEAVDPRNV